MPTDLLEKVADVQAMLSARLPRHSCHRDAAHSISTARHLKRR